MLFLATLPDTRPVLPWLPTLHTRQYVVLVSDTPGAVGAGPDCDGQVLVLHDLVNLSFSPPAKFVRRYGDAAAVLTGSARSFRTDVVSRQYPSDSESYHLPKETRADLEAVLERKRGMRR
jgi:3-methyl-2-oxobutanoate hydroxymethyltransferase